MNAPALFLQCAPLDTLFSDLTEPFDVSAQLSFLSSVSSHLRAHPPPLKYLKAFMKRLLKMLEEQNLEVVDELAEIAVEMTIRDYSLTDETEGQGYLVFLINKPIDFTDTGAFGEENKFVDRESDGKVTDYVVIRRNNFHNQVGMKLWKAGLLMGDFCINMPHLFKGRGVLELGSGTGVTGITLGAVCQPSVIHMTDFHCEVLENLRYNANVNIVNKNSFKVEHLDWNVYDEEKIKSLDSDILIAADCTYSIDLCVVVLETISSFLCFDNSVFSTDNACRNYSAWQSLVLNVDNETPAIMLSSKKICLLCFTIRSPETLDFFVNEIGKLSHKIRYQDITAWVLGSCKSSSFYYEGGKEDLRVLCIVCSSQEGKE